MKAANDASAAGEIDFSLLSAGINRGEELNMEPSQVREVGRENESKKDKQTKRKTRFEPLQQFLKRKKVISWQNWIENLRIAVLKWS